MKIKQVEELVGITSKNIRFYEEQGLLNPDRLENGYREYHQNHVDTLMKIKLLRKLGISVEEIKNVLDHKNDFETCIERQITQLDKDQENLSNMKALAKAIAEQSSDIDGLNTQQWLDEVEKMEKEGVDFVDTSRIDVHMKKKAGALTAGLVFIIFSLVAIVVFAWLFFTGEMPLYAFLIMIIGPSLTVICVAIAMKSRIKEIEGGEEDDASKY